MSDLTTLTGQLADMKQRMIDRLTAQGKTGYTMSDTMEDIVAAYETLRGLDYCTDTITENGSYIAPNGKTGYNSFTVNVPAGGPATHKKYNLLDRVYEDINGDSIGTVCGFHYDTNDTEYAIVCLDAAYRLAQGQYMSVSANIPGISQIASIAIYENKDTATFNCDKILDKCAASGYTSSAVSHCRSFSFIITGTSYTGQLPTQRELFKIAEWRTVLNSLDPTVIDNPNLIIPSGRYIWSSSCANSSYYWLIRNNGDSKGESATMQCFVCPILEIPNVVVSE